MPENLTKDLRTMIAMADFIANCNFDVDMKESTQEMGEFFYEKLTEIQDYLEEEERKKLSEGAK